MTELTPKKINELVAANPWLRKVPVRAQNVLLAAVLDGCIDSLDPVLVRAKGREWWRRMPNCGNVTITQIETAIGKFPDVAPRQQTDVPIFALKVPPADARSVFCLTLPSRMQTGDNVKGLYAAWREVWQRAGLDVAPGLLLLHPDMEIKALSDAELKRAGVMRIVPS
jgi:hypothetical protein